MDKNGHLTTRWMREDAAYFPTRSIKAPELRSTSEDKLPRGAVKEMREIRTALTARLKEDYKQAQSRGWNNMYGRDENHQNALVLLKEAFQNKEYDKMRVYEKYLSIDQKPKELSQLVDLLRDMTDGDVADKFTDGFMGEFWKLNRTMKTVTLGGFPPAIKHLSADERNDVMDFASELMFTRPGSGERLTSLITERGITDYDSLASALDESKEINNAVFGGVL